MIVEKLTNIGKWYNIALKSTIWDTIEFGNGISKDDLIVTRVYKADDETDTPAVEETTKIPNYFLNPENIQLKVKYNNSIADWLYNSIENN